MIKGWVRTRRDSKTFSFIEVNDGSGLKNMQVVVDADRAGVNVLKQLTTGCSVVVTGKMVPSQGSGQQWEIQADRIELPEKREA